MSIYKRGDLWHYAFMCNGERIRGSTGHTVEKDAKSFEKAKIKELRGDHAVSELAEKVQAVCFGKSIPLVDAYAEFLKIPRRTEPGAVRAHMNLAKWSDFLLFMSSKYPDIEQMNMVTTQHAEEYIQYLRQHGRYNKTANYKLSGVKVERTALAGKISVATVNDYIMLLKMVFAKLTNRAEIYRNPFTAIENQKKDTVAREAFTTEELKLIGEKSKGTYLYSLFLTGISTGLREGDICTLRWTEVNLQTGWIVNRVLSKTGKKVSIPLLPPLHKHLASLPQDEEYCFPELQKKYSNSCSIGRDVTVFLESIGIVSNIMAPGRSRKSSVKDVHSLRHTFAYIAAINNMPLPVVQSVLGHFSPEMTKMYMDHCTSGAKAEYMKMIPDYLSGDVIEVKSDTLALLESMTVENWRIVRDELVKAIKNP